MDIQKEITNEIKNFLDRLNIVSDSIDIKEHKLHPIFSIQTKDSALLIGNRGETLHALNYIIKKIVEQKISKDERFLIDINGYQERRLRELERQAELLADRARAFKREVELDPMSAYERMVVHSLFTNDPLIDTSSVGEGRFRRIVLQYLGE